MKKLMSWGPDRSVVCCALLLILIISNAHLYCYALDIYVDQVNGTQEDCCRQDGSCQTLNLALDCLKQNNHSTVWVRPDTYHLNASWGDAHFEFDGMQGIAIIALSNQTHETAVHVICSDVSTENGAGLSFVNSVNVTIRGILFDGCGVYHYSTSHSQISPNSNFFQFFTALYIMLCSDFALEYVHVNGTNGIGAVMYSTVGSSRIQNCNFSHNAVEVDGTIPGGGGVYIEFSYCLPTSRDDNDHNDVCDSSTNVPPSNSNGAEYTIEFTTFYKNSATVTHATDLTFILPHRSDHVAFGRGGGLSVYFKGNSTSNTIVVSNSMFTNNAALWGAGLFVEHQDNSQNNTFEIRSSVIDSNICYNSESESKGTGGGGARIGYIFFNDSYGLVKGNDISFNNVSFLNNKAYFGGGLSFYTAREKGNSDPTNTVSFNGCNWQKNVARVGSAADLTIWHPIASGAVVNPTFTRCKFLENSASYTTQLGSQVGIGALYADSIPITFFEDVQFISNTQTAMASISTGIYFKEGCHAKFINNKGRNGGAIALMGNSFFLVSQWTVMTFINNSAELKGGAIYGHSIGEHDLLSSRNCFIRYEDVESTPLNWTAKFNFENNTVANGDVNSIHVTSLLTCLWGGAFGSTKSIEEEADKVFCWSEDTWIYSSNCSEEISTSPARFIVKDSTNNDSTTVIPGKRTPINMDTADDRNNDVTNKTVFTAKLLPSDSSDSIVLDTNSLYISNRNFELYGKPGSSGTLILETIDPRVISTQMNVTLQACPPGMVEKQGSCRCAGNYGGYIECDGSSFSAKILRGSWIGKNSSSENSSGVYSLLVGQCPYCSLINSTQNIPLPENVSPNFLCKYINRTGELCGHCVDGYGPVVNGELQCVSCSPSEAKYHWFFYLLTEFLPIVIFFFIVIFFNVSATTGPANAFVFFAQVISTAFGINSNGAVSIGHAQLPLKHLYTIPYDIWNLNFFHPFLPKFCISSQITTLQLLSTGYITALFPLLLVVVFYLFVWLYGRGVAPIVCLCRPIHHCFARIRGIWNIKQSVLHALATFLLLSYTKFSLVSFILLTPTPLLDSDGNKERFVLYYDGTIDFFSSKHAPYIVASFSVLFTFVLLPPLVLMLPSFIHLLRVCLQKTVKYEGNLLSYEVGSVTGQFMTAFYECYKDGTGDPTGQSDANKHDFRWFAGMYFILRLMVFTVYAFTPDLFMLYMILQLICVGGILAFAGLRPYKKDWYNNLDATIFAVLAAINTLSMYNYFLVVVDKAPSVWIFSMQYVLIWIPLMYMVIYVVRHLFKKYVRCCRKALPSARRYALEEPEGEDRDFLVYTEGTGRLGGQLEYSINITEARNRQRSILEERNRTADKESQKLLPQDAKQEATGHSSGNSNNSSGYGATGSAHEASPGLSDNSEKEDTHSNLPVFGVQRMRLEEPPTRKERRTRLYQTQ